MLKLKFGLCAALMAVFNAWGVDSQFVWPENGIATIPKGTTVVVTDADFSKVNALDGIEIKEGATNVFLTSKAPTVQIKGYGAWVKHGSAVWNMTEPQTNFYGSFIVKEGVVTNAVSSAKGWPWTYDEDIYEFVVEEGAMFVNAATDAGISFGPHRIRIAGTGVNGEGAIVHLTSKSFTLCRLKMAGDAKIVSRHNNGYFVFGPYSEIAGRIELFGHTLSIDTVNVLTMYRNELVGEEGGLIRLVRGGLTFGAESGRDNPFLCLEPKAGAFAMASSCTITIRRDVPNIQVPLTIESGANVTLKHYHENYASDCLYNINSNSWAGPVVVEEGASLRLRTNKSSGGMHFRISGNISGAGSLLFPLQESGNPMSGDVYLESPTNSFAGGIFIGTNINNGSLYLSYSNSISDYSKCELVQGHLTARLTPGDHAWTPASLMDFAAGIRRSGDTFIAMDARAMPDETAYFDVSEFKLPEGADHYSFGADGGTVEISGKADRPVSLFSVDGTLKFVGEATLTNTVATSMGTTRFGEMLFDGAKVTTGIDGAYVGVFPNATHNSWPLNRTPIGRMRVRNSVFLTDYDNVLNSEPLTNTVDGVLVTNLLYGAVKVGWKGRGIFEIEDGAIVSNRFVVGTMLNSNYPHPNSPHHCQYGYGAVYQRGGEVALMGNKRWGSASFASVFGMGAKTFGYYEASGGRTHLAGQLTCGAYGTGVMYVDGGYVVATNHPAEPASTAPVIYIATMNYSKGALYVKNGGKFLNNRGETRAVINAASGMYGNFTASGADSYMGLGQLACGSKNVPMGNAVFFNALDQGTIEAWRFSANDIMPETNFVCVSFNGGTIKARSDGYAIFGSIATKNGTAPCTVVRVYEKGGAVDTAGHREIFSDAPIKAAEGGGVAEVPWTPLAGCQYPPLVLIKGDGYGASALAEFDSRSGTVTGVTVTSPGCGYTYAKAEFIFGYEGTDSSIATMTNDCVIAQNVTTGSFTKKGAGTLTLRAVNTWGGDTILARGVLKSGIDGAIPADGTFVLAGGTLDMNGTTLSDGTAMPRKWAVDVHSAIENGTVVYDGDLAFPEGSSLELRGSSEFPDSDAGFAVLTVTGFVTGAPALPELDNPRWKAWWSGKSIKVKKFYGTTVVFR